MATNVYFGHSGQSEVSENVFPMHSHDKNQNQVRTINPVLSLVCRRLQVSSMVRSQVIKLSFLLLLWLHYADFGRLLSISNLSGFLAESTSNCQTYIYAESNNSVQGL